MCRDFEALDCLLRISLDTLGLLGMLCVFRLPEKTESVVELALVDGQIRLASAARGACLP